MKYFLGLNFAIVGYIFYLSASNERRLNPNPKVPIPSQRWSSWTSTDDPSYQQKRALYHKNKKPLWERILPDSIIEGEHGSHHH